MKRQSVASQTLAIESFKTIAAAGSSPSTDAEVTEIEGVLRAGPKSVSDVAETLGWTSGRVAEALARGGRSGSFKFFKKDDRTIVAL